jgi:protein TonB
MKINPKVNLRLKARLQMELGFVLSLCFIIVLFLSFRNMEKKATATSDKTGVLSSVEIPETEQNKLPPPPAAASVPVASNEETLVSDLTIENNTDVTSFVAFEAPPLPTKAEGKGMKEEIPPFLPEENWPQFNRNELIKNIKYPEMAIMAHIQGEVVIDVKISKEGIPNAFNILKSLGKSGCDNAVIDGVKQTKFTPATQNGQPTAFWLKVKVTFELGTIK